MKIPLRLALAAVVLTAVLVPRHASAQEVVLIDPDTAEWTEVAPGVDRVVVQGDDTVGPYTAFTRFAPGQVNPLHRHNSDIWLVVIEGAYFYTPQGGETLRVEAGQYLLVPGGTVHTSGGDAEAGLLMYEGSSGAFDLVPVETP